KKEEEKIEEKVKGVEITDLEQICGSDKETCEALWHTMFYDPRKIDVTLEDAVKKATSFETKGDEREARMWYHVAGGLALWKGDVAKVEKYFGKCAKLAPEMGYERISKIPEKAVTKAQEFYERFLH
ncbi:MAG: hypothetical protein JSV51_07225, partial [Candidatus Bathyarchaeota archaeon]